ncbi:Tm-1-like ATP-binding domain-containing protein [Aestuariivirga sp.]|uniref:Tm-1-like ATP-binding domain-containing protein n=1 Tax=Aestuariivirga sp. TaxID=2650926 RepID=UPI0025BEBCC8|nr:Tm-1-like ATP-binding domain-containing protein [Aestuariivirga sp.]MCA3556293.1 Tm-1-like ATP-binding domain-containing protein [Aestuariivirga sp.]
MKPVYVIGTCDTKEAELRYAMERVQAAGAPALLVDISTARSHAQADVTPETVAKHHPSGAAAVMGHADRGKAIAAMAEALGNYLVSRGDIGAVLGLGGGGNTSMVTEAMRQLPIGVPKLMVSTMASGNVAPYVGPTDIMMMHAVADVAGLNAITRRVIGNAAHAAAGMAINAAAGMAINAAAGMAMNAVPAGHEAGRAVGLTMFGVTTPCITQIRRLIGGGCECFVFHATGAGGQCLEKLIDSGLITAALDITTTEVADRLSGGVLPCTEDRFGAVIRTRIPWVGSVGACDMVNFGGRDTVPARFAGRNLHVHNAQVTLMRTTAEENAAIGRWIVERVNRMEGPVRFLLPLHGVSAIDAPGKPFHDPAADAALFAAIRAAWTPAPNRQLIEIGAHINEKAFAEAAVHAFRDITGGQ